MKESDPQPQEIKLLIVGNSEVIPLRLVPYVTYPPVRQRDLLKHLYNPRGDYFPQLSAQSIDNPSLKIDSKSWRMMYEEEKDERFPAGMFVWREDFEKYRQFEVEVGGYIEIAELCLSYLIPDDILKVALEGFEHLRLYTGEQDKKPSGPVERVDTFDKKNEQEIRDYLEKLRTEGAPPETVVYELRKRGLTNVQIGRLLNLGADKTDNQRKALKMKVQRLYSEGKAKTI